MYIYIQYSDEECYQPLALEKSAKFTAYIAKVYFVDDGNSCQVATHDVINKLAAVYNEITTTWLEICQVL